MVVYCVEYDASDMSDARAGIRINEVYPERHVADDGCRWESHCCHRVRVGNLHEAGRPVQHRRQRSIKKLVSKISCLLRVDVGPLKLNKTQ